MAESFTYVGAAAASTGAILKIIQQGFAYTEVPHDVRAFQHSIESFNGTLQTAKRLRRVKSHLIDDRDKHEIDQNIRRGTQILEHVSTAIEACRKDLSNKGTVGVRNRLLWLIRDHQTFISRTHTLGICHQSLNTDVSVMRSLSSTVSTVQPPQDLLDFSQTLRPPNSRRIVPLSSHGEVVGGKEKDGSYPLRSPRHQTVSVTKSFGVVEEELEPEQKTLLKSFEMDFRETSKHVEGEPRNAGSLSSSDRRPVRISNGATIPARSQRKEESFSWEHTQPLNEQPKGSSSKVSDKPLWMGLCVNPDYCVDQTNDTGSMNELPAEDVPVQYLSPMPRRRRISSLHSAPSVISLGSAISDSTLVPDMDVANSIHERSETSTFDTPPTTTHRVWKTESIDSMSTASTLASPSMRPRMTRLDSVDNKSVQQSDFVTRSTKTDSVDEKPHASPLKSRRGRRSAMIT